MIGAWSVSEHGAGVAGPRPTALLMADDGADLVVSCDATGLSLFVSYVQPLPAAATLPVQWRTDAAPWRRQAWTVGPDGGMLLSAPAEPPRRLLARLAGARTLTFRAAGRTSRFDLRGVRQIADLMRGCPGVPPTP